ncbi:MAG: DNA/RNA nuclease SfsA [Sulfolobaceae archaeon]|jgi:sugar fermentation stimulation protein A|nr:DNA/RNA nuclease SfsA [Sulfolobaceae archaeon]
MASSSLVHEFTDPLWEEIVEKRLNRFTVLTKSGKLCHLHDPGRLQELIFEGNRILVRKGSGKKTQCWVTASWHPIANWVITDSSIHSQIARKFLPQNVKSEVKVGNSRIDFEFNNTFVEVKGCTLVKGGKALFPDAPTERGRKHLEELINLKKMGYNAKVLILVMRDDAVCFSPNWETDKKFSEAFKRAYHEGVGVEVKVLKLIDNKIYYIRDIPLCIDALYDPY